MINILGAAMPFRKAGGEEETPSRTATTKPNITMSYWAKRRKASEYLSWFFGQKIQLDVSVNEVQTYGLAAMLQSSVPLCYFLFYLLESYCSENLVQTCSFVIYSNSVVLLYRGGVL